MNNYIFNHDGGDEQYTPAETVELLLPYIKHLKDKIIWCPFDTKDSQFVKVLQKNDYNVIYSHIIEGKNFFTYEPDNFDVIISNPPYKNKKLFIERCLSFNKPFCLLLPINILSDSTINKLFCKQEDYFQLLIPLRRTKFYNAKTGEIGKQPTFKASYFGYKIFEKQIILEGEENE